MNWYDIQNTDCISAMHKVKSDSVDLILTDPPYNLGLFMKSRETNLKQMRSNFFGSAGWDNLEFEEWIESMDDFFAEAARTVKVGGSLIMFMSLIKIETIIKLAEKHGFYYKTTGIWHKLNPMPRNMNLHFINSTEAWLYFVYKKHTGTFNNDGKAIHDFFETSVTPTGERKFGKHPTQKPLALMSQFVRLLSNENDTVMDPFMGSGSSGEAALILKRNFIGSEINADYFQISNERLSLHGEQKMSYKIIDLFAGVGGLSLGFEMEGFNVVVANEYDPSIAKAYIKNRPNPNMIVEDITKLPIIETFGKYAGKVDVVVGGPPCQGFSQKGQRKTINDPRNFLFKYYVDVVRTVRAKYFVMENVPNLLTTEHGYFKKEVFELFESLGYGVDARVLCAADYGVPQNRNRAFVIGKLHSKSIGFPKAIEKHVTIWDAISDLNFLNSGEGEEIQRYRIDPQSDYQKVLRRNSQLLYNHVATNHSKTALERLELIPPKGGKEYLPKEHLTKSIYSGTWTRMDADDISVTITTRFDTPSSGRFTHPFLNRAITVREAARIQSFPDTFVFYGSKTSQMKQVGNAVPPLLAKAIAGFIKHDME